MNIMDAWGSCNLLSRSWSYGNDRWGYSCGPMSFIR